MNVRRKRPIGDGKGVTNGLMTLAPSGPALGAVDVRKLRANCIERGGTFDRATGACTIPESDPGGKVYDSNPTWEYQKKILLAGAAAAVLIILFRKER